MPPGASTMWRDGLRVLRRSVLSDSAWARLRRFRRFRLVEGPLTYNEDGLATRHSADFMKDPHFQIAYRSGRATGSWGGADIRWRAHVACWVADVARHLAGDFVECGVNRGGLSMTVMEALEFARMPRVFWLLDTFEGVPEISLTAAERDLGRIAGGYEPCYHDVVRTFSAYPNVRIVKGMVPDTLSAVDADSIAYLSLDMNVAAPEIAAAEHFWDRLVPGAMILLDDYGWSGHEVQRLAFDQFARRHDVSVLSLPTGQGLIVKPPR